jgi:shikimate kinase
LPEPELTEAPTVIALIGMPGGGKSTVGKLLAQRLGVSFADADEAIERRAGASIASLFEHQGEAAFRDLESTVLRELVETRTGVIATGGGSLLRADNRALLRDRTVPIYLHATLDELWRRVRRNNRRPLLRVADPRARLQALYEERHPLYVGVAAFSVETGKPPLAAVVDAIVARLGPPRGGPPGDERT